MDQQNQRAPDTPGHAPLSPDMSGQWLSVAEAVAYCARHGLNRNIKTIRRWAERSLKRPDDAEVKVREQDTGFGFRYMIDRASLDLKIRQELDFEAKQKRADTPGHDQAHPDMPATVHDETGPSDVEAERVDIPGHDQSGPDMSADARRLEVRTIGGDFLKEQIKEKDGQIAELNKQLERKDDQIMTMLERDHETNILIRGLQTTMSDILQLKPPTPVRDNEGIDEGYAEPRYPHDSRSDHESDAETVSEDIGDLSAGTMGTVDNDPQPDQRPGV